MENELSKIHIALSSINLRLYEIELLIAKNKIIEKNKKMKKTGGLFNTIKKV